MLRLAVGRGVTIENSGIGFNQCSWMPPRAFTSEHGNKMPTTVMWFEILSYLGLFLQVIAGALIYPELSGQLGEGFVYALTAIYISMSIFLIWSAARRRKNWARWFLLVGFGLGLLFSIPTMADDFKSNIVLGAFNAIMLL